MTDIAAMNNLEELDRERQSLALDAEEKKPGAAEALERVEARITEIRRSHERQDLATKERTARTDADEHEQAEALQRERQVRSAAIDVEIRALAPKIDDAATALAHLVDTFMTLTSEQSKLAVDGGRQQRTVAALENSLAWHLARIWPGQRPDRYYRRRLADILGAPTTAE